MGKTLGKADSTPKGMDLKNKPSSNVIDNKPKKTPKSRELTITMLI